MSQFGKHGRRCDWCGKFTNARDGEYTRPIKNEHGVNLAGYIRRPAWLINDDGSEKDQFKGDDSDICEECYSDLCPNCGSDQTARITPSEPGPYGWGGRCKACAFRWYMTAPAPSDLPTTNTQL